MMARSAGTAISASFSEILESIGSQSVLRIVALRAGEKNLRADALSDISTVGHRL
jgi:hypothetical protein